VWRRSAATTGSPPACSSAGGSKFGLTARKAPQLATVALADGAANEVPALVALRDLVWPPDEMTAIELEDGQRVFAPALPRLA
jgi:hypothetical protein